MARLPRYFVEGQAQHIIQRGNNREPIFAYDSDTHFYYECLQDAAEQQGLAIHAYVLMTNHVHILATPDTCMRYIELNPVRAGMVKHPLDYPWSSYAGNARGEEDELVSPHPLYRRLGRNPQARQSAYRQLFRSALGKGELDAIREATNTGWVLGNDRFREKIERLSGRRTTPKPRGRHERRLMSD